MEIQLHLLPFAGRQRGVVGDAVCFDVEGLEVPQKPPSQQTTRKDWMPTPRTW